MKKIVLKLYEFDELSKDSNQFRRIGYDSRRI